MINKGEQVFELGRKEEEVFLEEELVSRQVCLFRFLLELLAFLSVDTDTVGAILSDTVVSGRE